MDTQQQKRFDMIMGAAVADAAAMGLHWIYGQPQIRRVGGAEPEFMEPDEANYQGVPAYFAHKTRHSGDFSMYGEGLLVVLRSLAETGTFDWQHYSHAFGEHFGSGGEYVGYIDTPTRETLTNQILQQKELLQAAMEVPFDGPDKAKEAVAHKVMGNAQLVRGNALREKVDEAIRMTKGDDAQIDLAHRMIEILEARRALPGADDEQLPALTKVPVLVAANPDDPHLMEQIEAAVRVTNNNDTAVAWAQMVARVLRWTLTPDASPDGLEQAVRSAIAEAPAEVADAVNNVLKRTKDDNKVVTMKVGPACELKSGVPAAIHNLLGASDFVDAARRNIFACGDTCGRAMVVGSIAGALYAGSANALPVAWIERLTRATEVKKLVQSVTE